MRHTHDLITQFQSPLKGVQTSFKICKLTNKQNIQNLKKLSLSVTI